MRIDNNSTFSNSFEKVDFRKIAVIVEIKKFECLKKNSIIADSTRFLELYFILQLALESRL